MALSYDLIVVGAGHAGCEAAAAAARMGLSVAVVTFSAEQIARLSCNPAVGGLAKGHLVRELDALGGLMGRAADGSCIQFRRLNTRKGLAVQSSRAQVDIDVYPRLMGELLLAIPGVNLVPGEVIDVRTAKGRVSGVTLMGGASLDAPRVCLATGTFLAGILHCGERQKVGGRVGEGAAHHLSESLRGLGLRLRRLKTGTVPRLDASTIRWDKLAVQEDTSPEGRFSFGKRLSRLPTRDCYFAHTNENV
ncbi:MAG: FAD-dependent oxidoreductase, partial [Proteobacteria bacterium]|nr:FAD-dependent oxidoreductase [Pseudomonadota bacterium]